MSVRVFRSFYYFNQEKNKAKTVSIKSNEMVYSMFSFIVCRQLYSHRHNCEHHSSCSHFSLTRRRFATIINCITTTLSHRLLRFNIFKWNGKVTKIMFKRWKQNDELWWTKMNHATLFITSLSACIIIFIVIILHCTLFIFLRFTSKTDKFSSILLSVKNLSMKIRWSGEFALVLLIVLSPIIFQCLLVFLIAIFCAQLHNVNNNRIDFFFSLLVFSFFPRAIEATMINTWEDEEK